MEWWRGEELRKTLERELFVFVSIPIMIGFYSFGNQLEE